MFAQEKEQMSKGKGIVSSPLSLVPTRVLLHLVRSNSESKEGEKNARMKKMQKLQIGWSRFLRGFFPKAKRRQMVGMVELLLAPQEVYADAESSRCFEEFRHWKN
jgi:hypothetical protein